MLALKVTAAFEPKISDELISVEDIQDSVESVLIQAGYDDVAKGYILYRKQREKIRNLNSTLLDYKEIVDSYVKVTDWRVKENSTVTYSVGGLIQMCIRDSPFAVRTCVLLKLSVTYQKKIYNTGTEHMRES